MTTSSPPSDDDDALLASLEETSSSDPTLTHLRAARAQALSTLLKHRAHQLTLGFGTYTTLTSESALMELTTSISYCVVHFSKPDFNTCRIMDTHLSSLAGTHLETRFLKMDVAHAPFLVERLKVRVLPCVVAFVEGVGVGRVVGFEGLGGGKGDTSCETGDLERWLRGCGVLGGEEGVGGLGGRVESEGEGRGGDEEEEEDDDDDDEWD